MTFLQPLLLFGLPLASLPIVIHLLNRQRHRTIPWGAMMFLIDAKRMTRGMARLRYWLIMAMRVLAIAGLVFAVSRPLASGWLGSTVGGSADTTILILDRSASMEQQDVQTGQTKRSTALAKLSELMETLGGRSRLVLIENTENRAQEVDLVRSLSELPVTTATDTSSDIVAMLQTALDYVVDNQTGRTDIWVCSDLRENDWKPDDGRWPTVRQGFERLEGIRFFLLSYPEMAKDNVAVRVGGVRRRQIGNIAELVLDVELRRESISNQPLSFPVEFVINGARSVLSVQMNESEFALQGHTIPLDETTENGWGRVELPVDGNREDNTFYFVFAEPPEHHTSIVSDDRNSSEPLRLAAISPADPSITYSATVLTSDQANEIDWVTTSLLLWQAPVPSGVLAQQIQSFVKSGRPVIFFPPDQPTRDRIFDVGWGDWQELPGSQPVAIASWRGDSDLLRHTRSGTPLPVGKLRAFRHCSVDGGTVLARFDGGDALLTRATTDAGPAYFLATLAQPECSSLAQDGVVFYVMIQRALSTGAAMQGNARQLVAGTEPARVVSQWQALAQAEGDVLSSERSYRAGTFQQADKLIALNRPADEDLSRVLDETDIEKVLSGLDYRQVEDRVGNTSALASEIWRAFLFAMAAALMIEALLCLPEKKPKPVAVELAQAA